ncbi:zinc ribbon domain-containing protein [Ammonifex degensii]|uniref:zinc ribbon domain-containing protein n=1 Tax=Ammonifex degensii TaxID=42838 RepID=UPI00059E123B|nr:zinc ribbon domain-containing protein [Ammonifex degensii]
MGGLKSGLKDSLGASVPVERFEPTGQECYACGKRHGLSLSDRTIRCGCGWSCDRDLNAALVVLRKGLGLGPDQAVGSGPCPNSSPRRGKPLRRYWGATPTFA